MSVNEANSKLELLRQHIRELEIENAKIPDLKRKILEFDAERAKLKYKIAEALKMIEEERTRHGVENVKFKARIEKLKFENIKFRDRLTKVEQKQILNDNTPNNNPFNFNSDTSLSRELISEVSSISFKLSKEIKIDVFLDEM